MGLTSVKPYCRASTYAAENLVRSEFNARASCAHALRLGRNNNTCDIHAQSIFQTATET